MAQNRRIRRWRRAAIIVVVLALAAVGLQILIGKVLLQRIQTTVKQNLNANLSAENLSYRPPFTFVVRNCHFTIPHHTAPADVIDVGELRITLSRLPIGGGPTLLKDVELIDPVVQITKAPADVVDTQSLFPSGAATQPDLDQPGRKKPSQIAQIGHLSIKNGKIVLIDTSPQRNAWGQIQLDVDATGVSPSDYKFQFTAAGPIAKFQADGSVNVDRRATVLDHFVLNADFNSSAPSGDPLAQLAAKYHLRGSVALEGSVHINARQPSANRGWATIAVNDAAAVLPGFDSPIDSLQFNAVASVDENAAMLTITRFFSKSGETSCGLDGGLIRAAGKTLAINGLSGQFGNDQFTFSSEMPLDSLAHGIAQLTNIDSQINFHPPSPIYPDPLDKIFAQFRPSGSWHFQGLATAELQTGRIPNYDFKITTNGDAAANITGRDVDLTQIKADWEAFPDHVQISRMDCVALGGQIDADGTVACIRPYAFSGKLTSTGADLSMVAGLLRASSLQKSQYQGRLDLKATFSGSGPYGGKKAEELFAADGQFEIHNGILWDIPALQRIANSATIAQKALTMSEAAAYFHVVDRSVQLRDAAVSAPVLGLEGSGTVDFDGNIDMDVQAAPLADWQSKIDKTGVPIISNVAGGFAGLVQKILNTATGALLYKFHITGNASDPEVTTVPAPAITQGTARLFGYMLKPDNGGLLGLLQNPTSQPATQAATQPASRP